MHLQKSSYIVPIYKGREFNRYNLCCVIGILKKFYEKTLSASSEHLLDYVRATITLHPHTDAILAYLESEG